MPRPKSLTPTQIATAALSVIEERGLAELSMRSVAGALGVGTMSLYRYIRNRGELEDQVVTLILSGLDLRTPEQASWSERVSLLLYRLRATLSDHPAAIPLFVSRGHLAAELFCWGEAVLSALAAGGFSGEARAMAFRTLVTYAIGAVQLEPLASLANGRDQLPPGSVSGTPMLVDAAEVWRRVGADETFRRGLASVLHGLQASWE